LGNKKKHGVLEKLNPTIRVRRQDKVSTVPGHTPVFPTGIRTEGCVGPGVQLKVLAMGRQKIWERSGKPTGKSAKRANLGVNVRGEPAMERGKQGKGLWHETYSRYVV